LTPKWGKSYIIYGREGWNLGSMQASGNQCPERPASSRTGKERSKREKRAEKKKDTYSEDAGKRFL
jgi:hypothetical protein